MADKYIITLSVPLNAMLDVDFEEWLGLKLAGALGPGWRLVAW